MTMNMNIGFPVKAYGVQSDKKVALVNENMIREGHVFRQRAVFQPGRVVLPEDGA